jgi:hypothetical protein
MFHFVECVAGEAAFLPVLIVTFEPCLQVPQAPLLVASAAAGLLCFLALLPLAYLARQYVQSARQHGSADRAVKNTSGSGSESGSAIATASLFR